MEANKKVEEAEALKFSRLVYGCTTYSHKMKLIAYNDLGVLMQKPPSTEYIGRMSGSVYGESEWMFVKYDTDQRHIGYSPKEYAAFYKVGKLLVEDKVLLKEKFDIEIPKKVRVKKLAEPIWVVVCSHDFGSFGRYFKSDLSLRRLMKESDKEVLLEDNKGEIHSKSKRMIKMVKYPDSLKALDAYMKVERLVREHEEAALKVSAKRTEISDMFKTI